MELRLDRKWKKEKYTIGRLYVNGEFWCNTLEDPVREIAKDGTGKIKGVTAIPKGRYRVLVTMSPKFHRMLPYVMNVPHFEGIRIHSGNTAKDTEGCILVGENTKKGMVLNSRKWEKEVTDLLLAAQTAGDYIWLEIIE